jgi:hypothetical protein
MHVQIKVVPSGPDIVWDLQIGLHTHRGAFVEVQKVILIFEEIMVGDRDAYTKRLREAFGGKAELVYPYGQDS